MSGLREIARDVGVSVSLVSKVLNNRLGTSTVAPQTAEAIRNRARELNYRPNKSATALARGRHSVIGVIMHHEGEASSGIIDVMIRSFAAGADAHDQRLWLSFVTTSDEIRKALSKVDSSSLDGLILAGVAHPDMASELLRLEHEQRVPIITVHPTPLHEQIPNVGISQVEVMRIATAHLIEQGCRRIGHLIVTEMRLEGYRKALADAGIPFDPDLVHPTGYHAQPAEAGIQVLLDRGVEFDGFAAGSDQHAMVVMNALQRRGKRVPEDVRVTGIDDSPWCGLTLSPLTSVSQQFGPRAVRAIEMMMDRINGKPVQSCNFEPKLVVRKSSGVTD